jgi:hypothetical protein
MYQQQHSFAAVERFRNALAFTSVVSSDGGIVKVI